MSDHENKSVPNETTEKPREKFKLTKKHWLIFTAALVFIAISALALTPDINLFGSTTSSASYKYTDDPATWMSTIPNNTRIIDLAIPGTHDSAAGGYVWMIDSAQCQDRDKTITQQLNDGIRYFDLRLDESGNRLKLSHGGIDCGVYLTKGTTDKDGIMDEFKAFLDANVDETIIAQVSNETGVSALSDKFADEVLTPDEYKDYWYTGQTFPILGDVRGKIVLVRNFQVTKAADLPARGIPFYDVKNRPGNKNVESYKGTTVTAAGAPVSFYVQDRYSIGSAYNRVDRDARSNKKVELIYNLITEANSVSEKNGYFFINFWSHAFGAGGDLLTFPRHYAYRVNNRMRESITLNNVKLTPIDKFNSHVPGAQVMDHYLTENVIAVIKSNFTGAAETAFNKPVMTIEAPPIQDGWYYVQAGSYYMSTKEGKSGNGTPLALRTNGTTFQDTRFYFENLGNNEYRIKTSLADKYVENDNSSKNTGTAVSLYDWSNKANRLWIAEPHDNGFCFKNKLSGYYMAPDSLSEKAEFKQQSSSSIGFTLIPVISTDTSTTTPGIEDDWYNIKTLDGYFVTLKDKKTGDGTDLVLGTSSSGNESKFYIQQITPTEYLILSWDKKKNAEIDNSSYDDGAQAQIWSMSTKDNRLWTFIDAGNVEEGKADAGKSFYYILNKNSGSLLGFPKDKTVGDKTPVVQRVRFNQGAGFILIPTSKP